MARRTRPDDSRGGRRLGWQLRQEARGERPEFSAEFQARLMRRIEPRPRRQVAAEVRPASAAARAGGEGPGRGAWPLVAAVAAVLAIIAVGPGIVRREGPPSGAASQAPPAVATRQPPAGDDLPGIETLPTFDEIEQGLRDGVTTLAASLVEVPDWASLADSDAAALLGGFPGP